MGNGSASTPLSAGKQRMLPVIENCKLSAETEFTGIISMRKKNNNTAICLERGKKTSIFSI